MRESVVKRYTVQSAKCNNEPVAFGEFEYENGSSFDLPVHAVDWESPNQKLELVTTDGPLTFTLLLNQIPLALRARIDTVRCKVLDSDAACPSMFRSTGNAIK